MSSNGSGSGNDQDNKPKVPLQATSTSTSTSMTPLPAPPKFDPSSIKVNTARTGILKNKDIGRSGVSGSGGGAIGGGITTSKLNLPTPPPLPLPIKKSNVNVKASVSGSGSGSGSGKSTAIDIPTSTSTSTSRETSMHSTSNSNSGGTNIIDASASNDTSESTSTSMSASALTKPPRATMERIPTLQSAPPSDGSNINSNINSNSNGNHNSISDAQKNDIKKVQEQMKHYVTDDDNYNNNNMGMGTSIDMGMGMGMDDSDHDRLTIPKVPKRKHKYIQQPPQHLLTYAQRSIPILLIASSSAKEIAAKNNLKLGEMLNGLGNSMAKEAAGAGGGSGGGDASAGAGFGKLDPIRSVNRMLALKWDMVNLSFVEQFGSGTGTGTGTGTSDENKSNNQNQGAGAGAVNASKLPPKGGANSNSYPNESVWEERLDFVSENWRDEEDFSVLEHKIESIFAKENNGDDKAKDSNASKYGTRATTTMDMNKMSSHEGTSLMSHNKTPWYARFRHGINSQTSHQAFSMIHSPPVVLYVASSTEGVSGLEELKSKKYLPDEFKNGLFDPKGMREQYLILHDEQGEFGRSGISFDESRMIQELRNRFGASCTSVVRTNSNVLTADQIQDLEEDDVWDEFLMPDTPRSQVEYTRDLHRVRGALLAKKDKTSLRRFLAHLVTSILIPAIEKRIYELNVEVTNHKKGVKNVFKSFWRKPKDGLGGSMHGSTMNFSSHGSVAGSVDTKAAGTNDVPYRYDSIESQTRLLADTLFLIRDYEGALGMYKLVKDDYKHDQNLMHNGSAHEMMAICLYLSDMVSGYRSTREIIQYVETAMYLYTSAAEEDRLNQGGSRPPVASMATRCVTRLCLFLSSARSLCLGRDMETADSLAAASSKETPLGAAVLLEQSSGHYNRAGMQRKFAFHMLMAGHMFRSAGQEYHAVRCFASAMYVYHGGDRFWPELFNHLLSALAGQLYGMKRMQLSLQLYAKLVGTTGGGRVSVRSQQKFLDHLVAICRGYENDALESAKRMKLFYLRSDTSHFDEAAELLKFNARARGRLEIPNMNLPKIIDSTIDVMTSSSSSTNVMPTENASFGTPAKGSELVWQDMTCAAQAELRVTSSGKVDCLMDYSLEELTKKVIAEIDEERSNFQKKARVKKMSHSESPASRAKLEPISVSFEVSNPLSILVPISSMQLVARLVCSKTRRVYTNIEAIDIGTDESENKKPKKWKFAGSEKLFEVAHFARISPNTDDENNTWRSGSAENVDPFFLVTKGMMAMEPRSKSTISLELCPLAMGELEIVGVRCKIFNEIWVYHKFKVLGSLLQNNIFNRSNRIRSVPYLLHSKIEQTMPNISVDVIKNGEHGNNGVVLQGQVSEWILRVSNQGAAHATNLCLKLNVPWFNITSQDGTILPEDRETSHCFGPSGTMMRLPLHGNGRSGGTLGPGETVDIPIEIRTSGGGRQDFYMLFRYELYEKTTSSKPPPTSPKCRWLRKMVSVAVFPSLTVTASLTPSFSDKKDCILSVEMTNYRSDKETDLEIAIENISVISQNYGIKPLVKNNMSQNRKNQLSGHPISWQEQAVMHFIISPLEPSSANCTTSNCSLDESANDPSSSICSSVHIADFICLGNAHDKFTASLDEHRKELTKIEMELEKESQGPRSIAEIRRAKGGVLQLNSDVSDDNKIKKDMPHCHPTSRAFLCSSHNQNSSDINVVCSWKTKGENAEEMIIGQHHLRQLAVRPQHKSKSCPLLIGAKYKTSVEHDFSVSPLNLDMELSIRNRLVHSKVDFEFSLEDREEMDFMGPECFRKTLNGGDEIEFPLKAILFRSGLYNLQCVKLTVHNIDGSKTPYVFPLQWIVQVNH